MKFRLLTPLEQEQMDPTGKARALIESQRHQRDTFATPVSAFKRDAGEALSLYIEKTKSLRSSHTTYWQFWDQQAKVFGPQGGSVPLDTLVDGLRPYYEQAQDSHAIHEILYLGRDYLLQLIKDVMAADDRPSRDVRAPKYDTFSALPACTHKGSFDAETLGFSCGFRHMHPVMLGVRKMRGKVRNIFMDACPNVRYIEQELSAVKDWLRSHFDMFDSWLNPIISLKPRITKGIDSGAWFIEGDYEAMDAHFSLKVALEIVLPIYELLYPECSLSFAAAVTELFNQEVFLGDRVVTGLHNLFSGQVITSDFETIYTICLLLGSLIASDVHPSVASLYANGDDSGIQLPSRLSEALVRRIWENMETASNHSGLQLHPLGSKSGIYKGSFRYLRTVYYRGARRTSSGIIVGAYPTVLVLNNLVQPETPHSEESLELAASLQRLDGAIGSPDYQNLLDFFRRYFTYSQPCAEDLRAPLDWWERVYGERWNPASSPSFQRLYRR